MALTAHHKTRSLPPRVVFVRVEETDGFLAVPAGGEYVKELQSMTELGVDQLRPPSKVH